MNADFPTSVLARWYFGFVFPFVILFCVSYLSELLQIWIFPISCGPNNGYISSSTINGTIEVNILWTVLTQSNYPLLFSVVLCTT